MEYTGSVRTKKGKNGEIAYQIVIEGERDPVTGKRMRSYQTVHCKKREAIRLMNQIVAEKNAGTYFKGVPPPAAGLAGTMVPGLLHRPSGENDSSQLSG